MLTPARNAQKNYFKLETVTPLILDYRQPLLRDSLKTVFVIFFFNQSRSQVVCMCGFFVCTFLGVLLFLSVGGSFVRINIWI